MPYGRRRWKTWDVMGRNPRALPRFSQSTIGKIVRQITPIRVRDGRVRYIQVSKEDDAFDSYLICFFKLLNYPSILV